MPDRNIHVLLCVLDIFNHMYVTSIFSFRNNENTQTDIQLLESLSCVKFLSATLLHLLKILQLLAVRFPEL